MKRGGETMYKFPDNLYCDVRLEKVKSASISYTKGALEESRERETSGACIRVFDGQRWYFSNITDTDVIQNEITKLAALARPDQHITAHPLVRRFQPNQAEIIHFSENNISLVPVSKKNDLLRALFPIIGAEPAICTWTAVYSDFHAITEFYSSLGARIKFDRQLCGINISVSMASGDKKFSDKFSAGFDTISPLHAIGPELKEHLGKCRDFLLNAKEVVPGKYPVILSPEVAGVFAHESFGHKSEADFMMGDENMRKEWTIGKKVGADMLSITDDGSLPGSGYTPFDDEGTKCSRTWLVKDGRLAGRLHSVETAAELGEEPTGNCRAVNFEYEPIVRMTATCIEPGTLTKDGLFAGVKDGLFVETFKHGSGLSTFTIAPSLAYWIKDGKIAWPVKVSVISGNVMETLGLIDGLSDKLELKTRVGGGCGKMEQWPLPVGFGGPYVRVKELSVM